MAYADPHQTVMEIPAVSRAGAAQAVLMLLAGLALGWVAASAPEGPAPGAIEDWHGNVRVSSSVH